MILRLFRNDRRREPIARLLSGVAAASRSPGLYVALGVPDTLEGRFESLTLHAVLVLRALRRLPPPADEVARDLVDALFRQLDGSLREMGVGDTSIRKRMKSLAEAFYGRARAYDGALEAGDEASLAASLARNVLGRDDPAGALARYTLTAEHGLCMATLDGLLQDGPRFPPPETFAGEDT